MQLERVLQRLPDISLQLDARNEVSLKHAARLIPCGYHALPLLELFAQPLSVAEALEQLKPRFKGTQDWLLALRTIQHLATEGILIEPGFQASNTSFDQASLHIEMLQDEGRTSAFLQAIRQTVKPGQVVVEIGTGTGVLSVAAAQAGAAKVYAIEAGRVQALASSVFKRNQVDDRVQLLSGWSTSLELPESADVLVAEILGHDALGEGVVDTFHDAIRRFLKPSGMVIPAKIEIFGELVRIPTTTSARYRFEAEILAQWQRAYGVDFSSLAEGQQSISFGVDASDTLDWLRLSPPVLLGRAEFYPKLVELRCPESLDFPVAAKGEANGLLIWFRAHLSPSVTLSTRPQDVSPSGHWRNVVRLFASSKNLEPGQIQSLDCRRGYLASEWVH